jgi:hypothetical protein
LSNSASVNARENFYGSIAAKVVKNYDVAVGDGTDWFGRLVRRGISRTAANLGRMTPL